MTDLLQIDGLHKRFGGLVAVREMSLGIAEGEITALLGPNGSGKTTVLDMISGATRPTKGRIRLAGETVSGLSAHQVARRGVARTFQLVRVLPSLSVAENVLAALAFRRNPLWGADALARVEELLEEVGLGGSGNKLANDMTYIDQKRMELARALASEPRLLLLDEWLSGLNPTELRAGIDLILSLRDRGTTILLVEHIMAAVRALCSRAVVMNSGAMIADGPTEEVLASDEVVRAYLGNAQHA